MPNNDRYIAITKIPTVSLKIDYANINDIKRPQIHTERKKGEKPVKQSMIKKKNQLMAKTVK